MHYPKVFMSLYAKIRTPAPSILGLNILHFYGKLLPKSWLVTGRYMCVGVCMCTYMYVYAGVWEPAC